MLISTPHDNYDVSERTAAGIYFPSTNHELEENKTAGRKLYDIVFEHYNSMQLNVECEKYHSLFSH